MVAKRTRYEYGVSIGLVRGRVIAPLYSCLKVASFSDRNKEAFAERVGGEVGQPRQLRQETESSLTPSQCGRSCEEGFA